MTDQQWVLSPSLGFCTGRLALCTPQMGQM